MIHNVSDLRSHTGYVLRMVSNAVSQDFARRLASKDVTVAEWAMLRSLYGIDVIAPTALASEMGITKGAVTKLADRLSAKGFVRRADSPDDKRAHSLSLTPAGKREIPALAALADANDAAFFEPMGADEREQLRALLHRLVKAHGLSAMPLE